MKKKDKDSDANDEDNMSQNIGEGDSNPTDEISDEEKEKRLIEILSDNIFLFIIKRLRKGPIPRGALHKLIKGKNKGLPKKPREYLEKLIEYDFVREYKYKKEFPDPDGSKPLFPQIAVGQEEWFYILVKDIIAIRKPPITVLQQLDDLDCDKAEIQKFRKELDDFFNRYANKKESGDDKDVIDIFIRSELYFPIRMFSERIWSLGEFEEYCKNTLNADYEEIVRELVSKNFIRILQNKSSSDEKNNYLVLLSDIEVSTVFPEYILRDFNQKVAEREVDKEFALLTLNLLKKYYLELEEPDLYNQYIEEIEEIDEQFRKVVDGEIKMKPKKLKKLAGKLKSSYLKIGDYYKAKEIDEKLEELLSE